MANESPDNTPAVPEPPEGRMLVYQDGALKLQVRLDGQTVWLTQRALAELYQTTVSNISQHISSVYADGELTPEATIKDYLIVQLEGTRQITRTMDEQRGKP